jgi:hypothetical protein
LYEVQEFFCGVNFDYDQSFFLFDFELKMWFENFEQSSALNLFEVQGFGASLIIK